LKYTDPECSTGDASVIMLFWESSMILYQLCYSLWFLAMVSLNIYQLITYTDLYPMYDYKNIWFPSLSIELIWTTDLNSTSNIFHYFFMLFCFWRYLCSTIIECYLSNKRTAPCKLVLCHCMW